MKTCMNCGKSNPDDAVDCTCGYHFQTGESKSVQYISNSTSSGSEITRSSGDTIIKLARNYFIGSVLIAIAGAIVGFVWMSWDELGIGWIIVGASVVFAMYGWLIKVLVSSYGEMVSDTNRTKQHAAACEAYLKRIAEKLDKREQEYE